MKAEISRLLDMKWKKGSLSWQLSSYQVKLSREPFIINFHDMLCVYIKVHDPQPIHGAIPVPT